MPMSPPHVRVPISGPVPSFRNIHGKASPPEPACSLISITFAPKTTLGNVRSLPSRVIAAINSGRCNQSTM